ncbi:glutathione S-transferase Mu 2-like [Dermacentor andersoni]|uniref:glutathione S-transferase Mu 2-like n=1 Tax=Dermacentor andersoni TaxID=34620 RepID=UPI002155F092|nr:glutathione S-transferase Mu 2-like [Dermacentor andersoni]XP_054917552.1 glutathione S-transferase Mu 2-like [Dermacentor andersoni]
MAASVPVVGYTSARGLAQSVRNLLVYKGVHFQDKRYEFGPAPAYEKLGWEADRASLGLTFPNLPYYIDGDVRLTQTVAILRYLGKKHGLDARTDKEAAELWLLEQQSNDLLWALVVTAMNPNATEARKTHEQRLADALPRWQELLRKRRWALGDALTYVDFLLYEALDWNRQFAPDAFANRPELLDYLSRFEKLPKLKEYFASDKYVKWPIMAPYMFWGHK